MNLRKVKSVTGKSPYLLKNLESLGESSNVAKTESCESGPELCIVSPTFNERGNVAELVGKLRETLVGCSWEIIFVDDDSPDGTAEYVRALAREDRRIRCLQRINRRGLSSACIEGMLASAAPYIAVIDADLQHDETLLPKMLTILKEDKADIVIGSRYVGDGGIGDWNASRAAISRFATTLSRVVIPETLTDPMSGFFMLKRGVLSACVRKLSAIGFKILLDLFASSPGELRFVELPYQFRNRYAGESKLDSVAVWDYGMLLLDKLIGHIIPARFVAFSIVGGLGVFIHLMVLSLLFKVLNCSFVQGQTVATFAAMTFNFAVNNVLTYRDLRLRGWKWVRGLFSFIIVCSIGAFANVGIASYLFQRDVNWIPAALSGIIVSAVWNYTATMGYTWKKSHR
jgi:dolichol-phosphate mannosyltransferase